MNEPDDPHIMQQCIWNWEEPNRILLDITVPVRGTLSFSPIDLLYVLQKYQEAHGGIKVAIDFKNWRGIQGG